MATARILPTKDARDAWYLSPYICHLPTFMVASSFFPLGGEITHKWGRMATYPELGDSQLSLQEEKAHGETPHSMRVSVPSPIRPYPWSSGARNLGPKIKGETGFVAILGKTAKIHPIVVTPKIISPYHKRHDTQDFAWMHTEALLPFCNKAWGSKHNGGIFNTPILEVHYLWEKVHIYWRYWYVHIFGSLRNKNMSKHFWSRPIVGAFKYAHYG